MLVDTECFKLVRRPDNHPAYPLKWVLKIKIGPNGAVLKYKARLVFRGDRKTKLSKDTFASVVDFLSCGSYYQFLFNENTKLANLISQVLFYKPGFLEKYSCYHLSL